MPTLPAGIAHVGEDKICI